MGQTYSKEINIANSKACTELDPSWQKQRKFKEEL